MAVNVWQTDLIIYIDSQNIRKKLSKTHTSLSDLIQMNSPHGCFGKNLWNIVDWGELMIQFVFKQIDISRVFCLNKWMYIWNDQKTSGWYLLVIYFRSVGITGMLGSDFFFSRMPLGLVEWNFEISDDSRERISFSEVVLGQLVFDDIHQQLMWFIAINCN